MKIFQFTDEHGNTRLIQSSTVDKAICFNTQTKQKSLEDIRKEQLLSYITTEKKNKLQLKDFKSLLN